MVREDREADHSKCEECLDMATDRGTADFLGEIVWS